MSAAVPAAVPAIMSASPAVPAMIMAVMSMMVVVSAVFAVIIIVTMDVTRKHIRVSARKEIIVGRTVLVPVSLVSAFFSIITYNSLHNDIRNHTNKYNTYDQVDSAPFLER
jgi:hypothetical protein